MEAIIVVLLIGILVVLWTIGRAIVESETSSKASTQWLVRAIQAALEAVVRDLKNVAHAAVREVKDVGDDPEVLDIVGTDPDGCEWVLSEIFGPLSRGVGCTIQVKSQIPIVRLSLAVERPYFISDLRQGNQLLTAHDKVAFRRVDLDVDIGPAQILYVTVKRP